MVKWLINNLGLKLISLFLAIVLWFYVVGVESEEITRKIPLSVKPPSDKMTVVESTLQPLEVTMSAPRNMIAMISSTDLVAFHQIKGVDKAGEYSFRVTASDINLPPGNVKVIGIEPEIVTVTLDEIVVKELKVEVDFIGEPAEGYVIDNSRVSVDPNAALMKGPKSKLEKIEYIKTEPIDVVGRSRSFRKRVGIATNKDVSPVSDILIDVFVPIQEVFSTKEFSILPVRVFSSAAETYDIVLDPAEVSFTLSGPKRVLEGLEAKDILVYVDITGLKEDEHVLDLQLQLPPLVTLEGDNPKIKVTLEKIKSAE